MKRNRFCLLAALALACTVHPVHAQSNTVNFADYFPLTAESHGVKTFYQTYGISDTFSGTFTSTIGGVELVTYSNGTVIAGTYIQNFNGQGNVLATNDGMGVQILGDEDYYFSGSSNLTEPHASFYFGNVTDGEIIDVDILYELLKADSIVDDVRVNASVTRTAREDIHFDASARRTQSIVQDVQRYDSLISNRAHDDFKGVTGVG